MILLVLFFCATKNRQSDTWQYIDWPLYVTYSSVLPILIFSIILWSKSVALSDMVRGESDAMNYYAPRIHLQHLANRPMQILLMEQ